MEHLKRVSQGDGRLGLAWVPQGTAEPAAAAGSCDAGLCWQRGTEALDVAGEKSAVKVWVWHVFFLVLWLGFFPPLCVADLLPPPPGVLTGAAKWGQISVQAKIRSCLKQEVLGDSKTADFCRTLAPPALGKVGLVASSPLWGEAGRLGVGALGGPGEVRLALRGSPPLSRPLFPGSVPFSALPFASLWGRQHLISSSWP